MVSAGFSRIPKSAVDVIDACTNIKIIRNELKYIFNAEIGEEETDMCVALDIIERNAVKRGVKQGMKKGMKQGVKQGEKQGALRMLFSLVDDGKLVLEEAARRARLSEAAFCKEMEKAGYKRKPFPKD